MTTNTVQNSASVSPAPAARTRRFIPCRFQLAAGAGPLVLLALLHFAAFSTPALPVPGPWTPLFKGIDHAVGTNNPSIPGNFSTGLQVAHCVRVDLTDPDIRLFTTPRAPSYTLESRETLTLSVPHFLKNNQLQIASDANFYDANPGGADPTSEGLSCDVFGLQISAGTMISPQSSADVGADPRYAALLFTTNNQPAFVFVNRPPGTNTAGLFTAVTGYYPIVSNGVNIGAAAVNAYPDSWIHQAQPRTVFGISQDNRYLYIMTIDGRQNGYSNGALDSETAYWVLQFGAWNAINMDGGGSTALYMADSVGNPVPINHSSYVAGYGRERYIGSHFGVAAKPLPGFFNDVIVSPDDTTATVTWTTISPSTTQVEYGLTTNFDMATSVSSAMVTNHSALLTNLTPGTGYYFTAVSQIGGTVYTSSNYFFVTTNYLTTNSVFDLENAWTFTTENLDGVNWTATNYDDSTWQGSGPGALWVDRRGPNYMGDISIALNTPMPLDPGTGFPYLTYYLRTHFNFTNDLSGVSLLFQGYIDDGAVFYLNGTEIYRWFMPPVPTPILNSTLAAGYACSTGDASCPYYFLISGDLMTNLLAGDNVLAAEVHNYNAQSPDITFAVALSSTVPLDVVPALSIACSNNLAVVTWNRSGFTLQQAPALSGPWSDVPGPVVASPYATPISNSNLFFRLKR